MTEHFIHAATLAGATLTGVTGQTIEVTREKHEPESPGNIWNRLRAIKRQSAMIALSTSSVKQVLDLMPQGSGATAFPVPCLKLSAGAPLALYTVNNQDDVPLPTAGTVHEKLLVNLGAVALRRLTWAEPGDPIVASLNAYPLSADGEALYWAASQVALPAQAAVDADCTLDYITVGGSAIEAIHDVELDIDCPWTPRFKLPKSRYPDYISSAGARGICKVKLAYKSSDRTLLRAWGSGFKGSSIQTVELGLRDYAQAAERGATVYKIELKCLMEVTGAEDGRPSSASVTCESISTDGLTPFRWGY
jgi:hypothetical protein